MNKDYYIKDYNYIAKHILSSHDMIAEQLKNQRGYREVAFFVVPIIKSVRNLLTLLLNKT